MDGIGSIQATTLIQEFRLAAVKYAGNPAQSVKKDGKWVNISLCSKP